MIIVRESKSTKLIIKLDSKIRKFVERIIKDYKLTASKGDYKLTDDEFILFNTNQYNFTDIRNEAFQKKIPYEEI